MHVILLAAVTANGFIARATDELADWTSKEDKAFFVEETKKHRALIMGRTTFLTIGRSLPGRIIFVLTKTPDGILEVPGSVETISGTPKEALAHVEAKGFSSVVIAGGSNVYSQFLNAGVVDELALTVEPSLFTSGIPLANGLTNELRLKTISVTPLGEQSVLLRYAVVRKPS